HDRKSQTESCAFWIGLGEAFKDLFALRWIDAGAGVTHPELDLGSSPVRAESDHVTVARVLDGVIHELHQRLHNPLLIKTDDFIKFGVDKPVPINQGADLGQHRMKN